MNVETIIKINNNPLQRKFLRENSYWYKYLNRSDKYYQNFLDNMKAKYKLTTTDKINKAINGINTLKTFLEVLK